MSIGKSSTEDGEKAITIRMPNSVHKALEQKAKEDRRSINSEVVWLLETYAKGELIEFGKLKELLDRYERDRADKDVPMYFGVPDESRVADAPASEHPRKKEVRHRQK